MSASISTIMFTSDTTCSLREVPINPRKMPRGLKIAAPASPALKSVELPAADEIMSLKEKKEQDVADVAQSMSAALGQFGSTAWAEILLFSDLHSVGSIAAVCKHLCYCTFEDTNFWIAFDGHCCKPETGLTLLSPSSMRDTVRRRRFGLEGHWGLTFAQLALTSAHAKTFTAAIPILSGVRPDDDALEAARFVGALVGLLGTFDASCSLTRKAAEAVVQQAKEREEFLPKAAKPFAGAATPLKRLQSALQASIDHAAENSQLLLEDDISSSSSSSDEEQEEISLCADANMISECQATSRIHRVQTGLAAAALFAGSYVVSVMSEVVVDEGLQEFAILAAVVPAGFAFAWNQRKKRASSKLVGTKGKELNNDAGGFNLANLMRM
eukprot:gnl/MRDRNA2_/MRDRNA2_77369_c0_seq1.p1 gnl/MRDRNA2_/MRDRNA2_77369_c0~~gnl/MRDRNA2_/MRDRNA2_77369_c0_seq1.p1  ORF type:complete len:439 (+),score=95.10 gnl/MRDRNA2_/MRDRNA2_77369_c0_seq1:166-1317(+)